VSKLIAANGRYDYTKHSCGAVIPDYYDTIGSRDNAGTFLSIVSMKTKFCPECGGPTEIHEVPRRRPPIEEVASKVAEALGVTMEEMAGRDRGAVMAWRRHVLCYALFLHYSLADIGRVLHRDHSTITNSITQANHGYDSDPEIRALFEQARDALDAISA
jgi:hypothetical protein